MNTYDMSVYDEVAAEAAADHRAWLADEYEPIPGVDYDPAEGPTDEEIAEWNAASIPPSECPDCGSQDIGYETADPEVGFFSSAFYCEDCDWARDV